MSFIEEMESKLSLFESVHGRKPVDSDEFSEWCDHVDNNSTSHNSRRDMSKEMYADTNHGYYYKGEQL